jgi:DNA-binding CsgD family transcriptional regulator
VSTLDRVDQLCSRPLDERALRSALLDEIRRAVPFDAHAWLLTDPETCVGSSPLAAIPSLADLPALIRSKYLTPTNRWTGLRPDRPATLAEATGGDPSGSRLWAEVLSGYGIDDVLSTVFRDRYGCWGFLDLWRTGGGFTADEGRLLGRLTSVVTSALRDALVRTFEHSGGAAVGEDGPVVLMFSDDLQPLIQTPSTDAWLRALLPTDEDRVPVPAGAYNVAAQLLAREAGVDAHPPWTRAHVRDGLWVTLRAARLVGLPQPAGPSIAVSVEATPPAERTALYGRLAGLSGRERELLQHLVTGCDTRELAGRLFVSEHTVQDHLKSIFAKTGTNSRRLLIARATGAVSPGPEPGGAP